MGEATCAHKATEPKGRFKKSVVPLAFCTCEPLGGLVERSLSTCVFVWCGLKGLKPRLHELLRDSFHLWRVRR